MCDGELMNSTHFFRHRERPTRHALQALHEHRDVTHDCERKSGEGRGLDDGYMCE